MKRQLRDEMKKSQYAGTLASEHGLENHGLKHLNDVFWNLSTSELYEEILDREEGKIAHNGPLLVYTGEHTARAAHDKFVVRESSTKHDIWWGKHNKPYTKKKFANLSNRLKGYLQDKDVFVQDCYVGADENYGMPIRVITQYAWHSLFARNMFVVERDDEKLKEHVPEFTLISAPDFKADPEYDDLHSETFIILNFEERLAIIGGSKYGGEIKKSFFTIMNYLLPKRDVLTMHCSANVGQTGDVAIFFGLSGTGKTTLSTDPKRALIGDDEHGWDDNGVFNFEGGCYAKTINLDKESEPDIYNAIKRDALLENVTVDKDGNIDFDDASVTQNTRVSYPLYHIENIVKPVSKAGPAQKVIFLTADAFGVMPPVSKLTPEQTKYHFLSGFTAKLAGTELGITAPSPTFSACFGAAFLTLHPTKYGQELIKKMEANNAEAYLVNTGWNGTGKRISIKDTRGIIDAILDGSIEKSETKMIPIFDLEVPTSLPGVDSNILDPRDTYKKVSKWDSKAMDLAKLFIKNFEQYTDNEEGKKLVAAGPQLTKATMS